MEIKNISDESLADVEIVKTLYTSKGKFFGAGRALIDKNPLLPGETSWFLVSVAREKDITRYKLSFRFLSGEDILHERADR